jgi:ABC-2 type transport system ATP-binding protein
MAMKAVLIQNLTKTFEKGKRTALKQISAALPKGNITGIVGPDGAGKTTLLRILAGLMIADAGTCSVWGYDIYKEPEKIQDNLGYLPQKFGLYEDLTVSQNLSLYADLQGVSKGDPIFTRLMGFSGLGAFQNRLAGDLSGGMKQKLGLMATLLRKPNILLLDEPTTGLDPLSQKELWKMIFELNAQGMTIILSTSYLEEAEKCDYGLVLNQGTFLFTGPPEAFKEKVKGKTFYFEGVGDVKRTILDKLLGVNGIIDTIVEGEKIRVTFNTTDPVKDPQAYNLDARAILVARPPRFEDAFIQQLGGVPKRPSVAFSRRGEKIEGGEASVEAKNLTKYFGSFKAVDNISFSMKKGEIFGFLGPNGAGKSTTFKMLCGLISPTEGEALVGGVSLRNTPWKTRGLIGYMAQKFSLYNNMTVLQNLNFFSGIYAIENRKKMVEEMIAIFDLELYRHTLSSDLPLGYKQRLALSCALMHKPQVLFLDEPTSGVDPLTRREFWHQINLLASAGVSIMVSTHLMDEAEFCDRIGFIHNGILKIIGTPDQLKKQVPAAVNPHPALVDAFLYFCAENPPIISEH